MSRLSLPHHRHALFAILALAASASGPVLAQDEPTEPPPASEPDEARAGETPAGETPAGEPALPREDYNGALEALDAGDHETAIERFGAARDRAGTDAELRWRAAYNLGLALVARADARLAPPDGVGPAAAPPHPGAAAGPDAEALEAALDDLRRAAAWFRDAVRQRPDEADARINLELVLRRIQRLADQLNREEGGLEARLDRLIEEQRALRDGVRGLVGRVDASGAASMPLAFAEPFRGLAGRERELLAELGTVASLAADEVAEIETTPEEERTEEQRVRAVQLTNAGFFLDRARERMADARRGLRRLSGDQAHRRASAALRELKRAREQLLDPVTLLRALGRDEAAILGETRALAALTGGSLSGTGDLGVAPPSPPAWLTPAYLGERQADVRQRTAELAARLTAGVESRNDPDDGASAPADPQAQALARMLDAAAEALPFIETADAAMERAGRALDADDAAAAVEPEEEALLALARAAERFADLETLIELAWAEQRDVVGALTPPDARDGEEGDPERDGPSPAERVRIVTDGVAANGERLVRLGGLIAAERAALDAAPPTPPGPAPTPGGGAGPEQAAAAAQRQRLELAETERTAAAAAIASMASRLEGDSDDPDALRADAGEALTRLEALRRLFFTIVEHVRELLEDQQETADATADAAAAPAEERAAAARPLATPQRGHGEVADELGRALGEMAEQMDAAGGAGPGAPGGSPHGAGAAGGAEAADAARAHREASAEVHAARDEMRAAAGELEGAPGGGEDDGALEPVLEHQAAAIEHLARAIELLQPPDPQDQNEPQEPQPQDQEQSEQRSQSAEKQLQAIREREAERRRRQAGRGGRQPVEKDW